MSRYSNLLRGFYERLYEVCLWNTNSSTNELVFPDEMAKRGFAIMPDDFDSVPIQPVAINEVEGNKALPLPRTLTGMSLTESGMCYRY